MSAEDGSAAAEVRGEKGFERAMVGGGGDVVVFGLILDGFFLVKSAFVSRCSVDSRL